MFVTLTGPANGAAVRRTFRAWRASIDFEVERALTGGRQRDNLRNSTSSVTKLSAEHTPA